MPQPNLEDVHFDSLLTDFSVGYIQDPSHFIADNVFPRKMVNHQSNKYATFDIGDMNRDDMERRAPAAESAGTGYGTSSDNYSVDKWALHQDVDWDTIANSDDAHQPLQNATRILAQKERIRRDRQWVTDFFTTSIWGTDITGGTNFTQINDDTSDPINLIGDYQLTVGAATGFEPRTLVLSAKGWLKLRNHPDIVSRINGGATPGGPAVANLQSVAAIMNLDRILVSRGVYNSAAEGATDSMTWIAGNHALLCYVDPSPGLMTPTAGMQFVWLADPNAVEGRVIRTIDDAKTQSTRVEVESGWDMKVTGSSLGVFMSGFVAD